MALGSGNISRGAAHAGHLALSSDGVNWIQLVAFSSDGVNWIQLVALKRRGQLDSAWRFLKRRGQLDSACPAPPALLRGQLAAGSLWLTMSG
jgi:hypothetical protein